MAKAKLERVVWKMMSHWRACTSDTHPGKYLGSPNTEAILHRVGTPFATAGQHNATGTNQVPTTLLPNDMDMLEHVDTPM